MFRSRAGLNGFHDITACVVMKKPKRGVPVVAHALGQPANKRCFGMPEWQGVSGPRHAMGEVFSGSCGVHSRRGGLTVRHGRHALDTRDEEQIFSDLPRGSGPGRSIGPLGDRALQRIRKFFQISQIPRTRICKETRFFPGVPFRDGWAACAASSAHLGDASRPAQMPSLPCVARGMPNVGWESLQAAVSTAISQIDSIRLHRGQYPVSNCYAYCTAA